MLTTRYWAIALLLFAFSTRADEIITPRDDLATEIETVGAEHGLVQLGRGVYTLSRPVTCPNGTQIVGVGGYANSGRGTEIRLAFDGDYGLRWDGSGGVRDLSITLAPNKRVDRAIYLDGSTTTARPTWYQLSNVVLPKYRNQPSARVGLYADGSAWVTPGSEGVRDLTISGFYAYGCETAIYFDRVVNTSITGGACGPAGTGRARLEFKNCDLLFVANHALFGDAVFTNCKNVSWMGGRLDAVTWTGCTNTVMMQCNPKVK